jgi:hypothetical protein
MRTIGAHEWNDIDSDQHRLFLSATPHNGHSNSFSRLLEMLDPQRFIRGMDVRPRDLDRIMIRRLKADLRQLDPDSFPERVIEAIPLDAPGTEPELKLAEMLRAYGKLRSKRISQLSAGKTARAKLSFIGLQQRLLSSVHAFAKTLAVHRASLVKAIEAAEAHRGLEAIPISMDAIDTLETQEELPIDLTEEDAEKIIEEDEIAIAQTTAELGTVDASREELKVELSAVDQMRDLAEQNRRDARVRWLVDWIRTHMVAGTAWNDRHLVIFTEYEDTRRYLERRLKEAFGDTDRGDERIGIFTGATSLDRREEIKRAFNADPAVESIRILICTDAPVKASTCRPAATTSSISICRGIPRASSSATDASTENTSRRRRSSADTSSIRIAPRTWCSTRSCVRPRNGICRNQPEHAFRAH